MCNDDKTDGFRVQWYESGQMKSAGEYKYNKQVSISTSYLGYTLFGAGLGVSTFAINYYFTNNLVFLWMIFYLILLVLLILIAPSLFPTRLVHI
jgi:hypothetical protein